MGFAAADAELVMDVDDDANWSVAGDTFGLIFSQACVRIDNKQGFAARPPSPPPLPTQSPSPNLLVAQYGAKTVIGAVLQGLDDADSEDMQSTIGGASILAEDSRSTVFQEDWGAETESPRQAVRQDVDKSRNKARILLQEAALNGKLEEAFTQVGVGDTLQSARKLAANVLMSAMDDGSLAAALASVDKQPSTQDTATAEMDEVRMMAKGAVLQGLVDGRLDAALAQGFGQAAAQNDETDEVRAMTRNAILTGLADGRLDSLLAEAATGTQSEESQALVPQPPPGARPVGSWHSPARNRRPLAGSPMEQVMQMISDADRKVGTLQHQVGQKERQIKDADTTTQTLNDNIQFVRADLEHLAVDLQWHQGQIVSAEDRWGKLNEDRRALALKLDDMRLKSLKDEWPATTKQSQTAHSWTSTVTGGGAPTAIESSYSGWTPERSAMSTFVTQGPSATS